MKSKSCIKNGNLKNADTEELKLLKKLIAKNPLVIANKMDKVRDDDNFARKEITNWMLFVTCNIGW